MNPDDISAHLRARNVITMNEKADVDLQTFTPQVRMDKLLAAVQRAINIDPQNYETFRDILGKEKKYSVLVKEMRGKVPFHIILGTAVYHTLMMYYCNFSHFLFHLASSIVQRIACSFGSN